MKVVKVAGQAFFGWPKAGLSHSDMCLKMGCHLSGNRGHFKFVKVVTTQHFVD